MIKVIETESKMVARDHETRTWRVVFNGYEDSVTQDEKILSVPSTILLTVGNSTALCAQ